MTVYLFSSDSLSSFEQYTEIEVGIVQYLWTRDLV